jgi:D-proline reductase (dithiol) PrdB
MGADAGIRARVGTLPAPDLTPTATVLTKPLSDCRVAIVTTAGLRPNGDVKLWMDGTFTVLPADARDLQLSHFSPNFDRAGLTKDLNTAYPADRLNELVDADVIGSVATNHLSFMGAQTDATFSTIIQDTGPAAAQMLIDDGVDVVLLTPV